MPYQSPQFAHEEIARAPRGWKIRTSTTPTGARVRIAYPPGPRRRGSGRVISILHPNPGPRTPNPGNRRKPVDTITDRAKRYRANARPPAGPRVCELCGATPRTGFIVIDHRDGNEANGRRRNLRWLCQSCNVREGNRQRRRGVGVPTRQFNPGDVRQMTGGQINRALDSNSRQQSKVVDQLIAAGRGEERISEILTKTDPLSLKYGALLDRFADLMNEARARYGPGFSPRFRNRKSQIANRKSKNPGAKNLYQYTEAAYHHQRGAHDWGGEIIHDTPIEHRRKFAAEIWRRRRGEAPQPVRLNPKKIIRLYRGLGAWMLSADYTGGYGTRTPFPADEDFATVKAAVEKLPIAQGYEIRNVTKGNPRRRAANPPPLVEAIERYQMSHGHPPREILDAQRSDKVRRTYVVIGESPSLCEIEIAGPDCDLDNLPDLAELDPDAEIPGTIPLDFERDGVDLACDPRGNQLYLIGGDQSLDAEDLAHFGTDTKKDLIELGPVISLTYRKRGAPRYHLARYRHFLGEQSGEQPIAYYDRIKGEIGLVGGRYHVSDWIYD